MPDYNDYKELTFCGWEKNVYRNESDDDRKKRHEQEDQKRESNILIRGLLDTTFVITAVAQLVDFIKLWLMSRNKPSNERLSNLDFNQLC